MVGMSHPYGENPPNQDPYTQPSSGAPEGQNPYSQPSPYAASGPGAEGQTPYSQPSPYGPSGPSQYGQDSYGQGSYGQPAPYGQQPAYGYGAPAAEHPQGTLILVFGIIGIFVGIFAPIAWYMGNKARKEIAASGAHYSNEQNINIGRILGLVFTILYIVTIVLSIVFVVIVGGIAASQGGR